MSTIEHSAQLSPTTALPNVAIGKSAVRKASWRLLPLIALGYCMAYMDRVNISFASLQMNRDLHFSATVYGFGAQPMNEAGVDSRTQRSDAVFAQFADTAMRTHGNSAASRGGAGRTR